MNMYIYDMYYNMCLRIIDEFKIENTEYLLFKFFIILIILNYI